MAPRVSHLNQNQQVPTATDMKKQSGGIRRKTPPRVCTTTTTTTTNPWYSLGGRSSPSSPSSRRVTPPRGASTPRSSPSRQQLPSRLARKMIQLWSAVETGDIIEAMQLVQVVGPSVTRDDSGCSMLHVAASNNQPKSVRWLLTLLSPNLVNKAGLTPVHIAAMKGHTQVLNMLRDDHDIDHLATDTAGNTYQHWLCVPLFEAVLRWDKKKVQDLMEVGADPDMDGGRVVGGALVRELRVTTARQLASSLGRECIFPPVTQKTNQQPHLDTNDIFHHLSETKQTLPLDQLPMGSLRLQHLPVQSRVDQDNIDGSDLSYNNNNNNSNNKKGAYVTILSYSTFEGSPNLDLPSSTSSAQNLADVFTKMGYRGHVHKDLTQQQTKQVLSHVRRMEELDEVSCAIFVISSHGTQQQNFLTSDGQLIETEWMCRFFRDSQCPQLKDKPKLFILDLCCGYYKPSGVEETCKRRVEEPLKDTLCLYSNSGELTWYKAVRGDSTPFTNSLCRTLVQNGHQEFSDFYRRFLTNYNSVMPMSAPHVKNTGFSKKFYFTPTTSTSTN